MRTKGKAGFRETREEIVGPAGKGKRRGGWPKRAPEPGERVAMNFRVTPELKRRLDQSAQLSGRSLTQEIEFRLDASFVQQDQAEAFQTAIYPRQVAGLLSIFARVMRDVGAFASLYSTGSLDRSEWLENPYAFDQVGRALLMCLEAARPDGDIQVPTHQNQDLSRLGEMIAARMLQALANELIGGELGDWATPIRAKLGKIAERLHVHAERVAVPSIWPAPANPAVLYFLSKEAPEAKS